MKTSKLIITIIAVLSLSSAFTACKNNNSNSNSAQSTNNTIKKQPTKAELLATIHSLEQKVFEDSTGTINRGPAIELILKYSQYANLFPQDTISPDYLFQAADLSRGIGDGKTAIIFYKRLIKNYPNANKRAISIFLTAFTYENLMNDTANARKYYTQFLKEYPKHEFADDAKMSLKYLGKTPEEIVKSFQKK